MDKKIHVMIARAILYVTATLVIIVVGAFLALQTRPVRESLMRIIEEAVAENTRAVCRIEKLNGNLLSRFGINGLEISDSATGETLMTADRIDVAYSIPMLLGRVLWISRLTVDGVSVDLLQHDDGSWNFEMLAPQPPAPLPPGTAAGEPQLSSGADFLTVKVRQLLVRNSRVTVVERAESVETIHRFNGIECQARLSIGKDLSATVNRLMVRLDNPHIDLENFSGDIGYDFVKRQLDFKDARITGKKSDFTVNGLLYFPDQGPDPVMMDLRADIEKLSLGEFGRTFPIEMPDEDIVSGDISVSGPVSKMDCRVDLHMDDLHVKSKGLVSVDENYDVCLDIDGKLGALDLSALPVLELTDFPGVLNSDFSLFWQKIGMPDQSGQIRLDLQASEMWGYLINDAIVDVRITGADFIFEDVRLNTPYGRLAGTGELIGFMASEKDNQIRFTADIDGLNPAQLAKDNQYAGSLNGNVRSAVFIPKTYAVEGITAEAFFRIDPSQLMNMDILSADIDASWQDEKIILNRFDMETGLGTAAVTGTASVREETCRLKAKASLPDIQPIRAFIPDMTDDAALSGRVSVAADINGRWDRPDVKASLSGEKLVFRSVSADSLAAAGNWRGGFKELRMSGKSSAKNLRINGLRISLLDLNAAMNPETVTVDIDLQGGKNEHLALSGKIHHWMAPEKEIFIDKISLVSLDQPELVNRGPLKLSVSGECIMFDPFHLETGQASLLLKGGVRLNPPAEVSANLSLKDFNLKRISGFWEAGEKIEGRLSSEIQVSGGLENPLIHMTTSVANVAVDKLPAMDISAVVNYGDSRMAVSGSAFRHGQKILDVNGSAQMDLSLYPFQFTPTPGGLNLQIAMDQVDISWISAMINDPEYDISGTVNADASVSGDFFHPDVQGRMQLGEGSLKLKKQALIYELLTADIRFNKNTITIEDLSVTGDREGSLHLSGVLTHDQYQPQTFNIRAVGDQLYVPFHSGVDARINPDLTLSGTWDAPVLSGKIRVPEGRVDLERFLEEKFTEIEIVAPVNIENGVLQIPDNEPEPLAFVDPLSADVSVIVPNDFWFKGTDEFIEIKGDIQLKKDPRKPFVLYGSVFPVRGTYRFRGRLFQITQGELIFIGQEDINPAINIEAVHTINDVKIIIRLTGTFEQLNLALDSDPAMSRSEIISYLIFGRSPDDLTEKESFQAGEAALSFTGQIAADKLRDIVGDTLGIDYMNISAGAGSLRQGSLTMGKYVLPRVFVTFRQGFDESVTQKVEVTYEINKYLDLQTQIDNEQTSALDLIWKREF